MHKNKKRAVATGCGLVTLTGVVLVGNAAFLAGLAAVIAADVLTGRRVRLALNVEARLLKPARR